MADEIIVETVSTEVVEVGVVGPQGPAGSAGAAGPANTLSIGTVSSGASASATITGTAPSQTLSLVLPKGDKGDTGAQGPAGTGIETLTTKGDLLSRDDSAAIRVGIGTTGQVLKVSAQGLPTWANESGAVSSVAGKTGVVTLDKNDVGLGNVSNAAQVTSVTGTAPIVSSGGTTPAISISAATTSAAGSMSAADKTKLDGIAAGAEVNVNADWNASSGDAQILNKPSTFAPSAHSSSHAVGGSDPLAPSDIGAQSLFTAVNVTSGVETSPHQLSALRAQAVRVAVNANFTIRLPETGHQSGDIVEIRAATLSSGAITIERGVGPSSWTTLATITIQGGKLRFVANGTGRSNWDEDTYFTTNGTIGAPAVHEHAASAITSGTLDIARIPTGTGSTQVALGDHTHAQLHDRSHAITSTSDHTAGNHKVFYSDGSGQVQELALGSSGTVLTSNGATSAPSFAAAAASGVSSVNSTLADILSVSGSDLVADDLGADKLYGFDDSEGKAIGFTIGSGLSVSGDTLSATASGGSKTYAVFSAEHNQPPSTAFATLDTRNSIAVLDFDDATDESAVFVSIIPEGASLGSGLKIRLHWMATTATSGNVVWDVSLERMTTDLDSDSFDTIASGTAAANGTSGILTVTEITLTTIDSVTAGDGFRIKVTRDANNASDTMTGDAELVVCEVRSAA